MLKILPKAKKQTEIDLIFSEGISPYHLPSGNRLEALFYSEIQVNKNNELLQISKILGIDLSVFFTHPKYQYAGEYFSLLCDLEIIDDKTSVEAKALQLEIVKSEEKFKDNYFSTNEGWAEITKMKAAVAELYLQIFQNPNYHQQINYNLLWGKYFHIDQENPPTPTTEAEKEAYGQQFQKNLHQQLKEEITGNPEKYGSGKPPADMFTTIEAIAKKYKDKNPNNFEEGKRLYKDIPVFLERLKEIEQVGYTHVTLFNT